MKLARAYLSRSTSYTVFGMSLVQATADVAEQCCYGYHRSELMPQTLGTVSLFIAVSAMFSRGGKGANGRLIVFVV